MTQFSNVVRTVANTSGWLASDGNDLVVGSMSIRELVTALEDEWGVILPKEDLTEVNFKNVESASSLLASRATK